MLDWLFENPQQLKKPQRPRRNKPCPCGSGLKYKKCHYLLIRQRAINIELARKDQEKFEQEKKEKGIVVLD